MPMLESIKWQFHNRGKVGGDAVFTGHENGSSALPSKKCSHSKNKSSVEGLNAHSPNTTGGEAIVAGADGPAILKYELPDTVDRQPDSVRLNLTLALGPGADVKYRTHVLETNVQLSLVTTCDPKTKMEAAWANADFGAAHISVRSQVT